MASGPLWPDPLETPRGDVAQFVRDVTNRLVSELDEARRLTGGWNDSPLCDALVDRAFSAALARLTRTGLWGRENELPSGELWKIAGELLSVGVLQERARRKPLGYAGDHQMLAWMCENYTCDHPLGRLFDRFFQRQAAPAAVRSRTDLVAAEIAAAALSAGGRACRVASVGCGPAVDVTKAISMLPESHRYELEIVLMDLDDEALAFAGDRIGNALHPRQVISVRENLFRLPQKKDAAAHLDGCHLIVCTGLFDYLEDDAAAALLRCFWDRLAPGGKLLVGNFAPHCPTRAYMEWIGNWYLIYRTSQELAAVAKLADLPDGVGTVTAEPLGFDLFLKAAKK